VKSKWCFLQNGLKIRPVALSVCVSGITTSFLFHHMFEGKMYLFKVREDSPETIRSISLFEHMVISITSCFLQSIKVSSVPLFRMIRLVLMKKSCRLSPLGLIFVLIVVPILYDGNHNPEITRVFFPQHKSPVSWLLPVVVGSWSHRACILTLLTRPCIGSQEDWFSAARLWCPRCWAVA